jgi:hypothetical protein
MNERKIERSSTKNKMAKKKKNIEITMENILLYLKLTGHYAPLLKEVVERKVAVEGAKKNGIAVTIRQLQRAADVFRLAHHLTQAQDFENWLASSGISLKTFEKHLEEDLYISQFKDLLKSKSDKANYPAAPEIKSTIRDLEYHKWLTKNLS